MKITNNTGLNLEVHKLGDYNIEEVVVIGKEDSKEIEAKFETIVISKKKGKRGRPRKD